MLIRLDQKGGSLLVHDGAVRVALKAGVDTEVDDTVGAALVAEYDNIVSAVPVVTAPVVEAPPADMPAEPEQPVTSTSGAISTSDLKPGGRRGRRPRKGS